MENQTVRISVITSVYNRANKIHRVFESLEKSTFRNFELVIMDDGSTDNIVEVVNHYKEKVSYPVTFLRQEENRGKHTVVNVLHQKARGEYAIQLDSDDELTPDALEKALNAWDRIAPEKKDEYWCVAGRTMDQRKREILGVPYPDGINDLDWMIAREIARKNPGEKCSLWRTDVLKTFAYPEPEGVKFVSERLMWHSIENNYKNYFINDILLVYHINDGDCLSKPTKNQQWAKNTYFNFLYVLNRHKTFDIRFKDYWIFMIHLCFCSLVLPSQFKAKLEKPTLRTKLAMGLLFPTMWLMLPLIKKKIGWVG